MQFETGCLGMRTKCLEGGGRLPSHFKHSPFLKACPSLILRSPKTAAGRKMICLLQNIEPLPPSSRYDEDPSVAEQPKPKQPEGPDLGIVSKRYTGASKSQR